MDSDFEILMGRVERYQDSTDKDMGLDEGIALALRDVRTKLEILGEGLVLSCR
jgi:hypothetical protein